MNHKNLTLAILILVWAALLTACGSAAMPSATSAPAASTPVATTAPAPTGNETDTTEPLAAPESSAPAKLNLNQVTADELLAAIPGFSNRMVREFQEYRPYTSIQQYRREIGKYVSDAQVSEWEQYVYVPVAVDEADAETLKQLPGVDDTIAQALIAGRPYGSNEAFLTALASHVGAEQVAAAAAYLAAN
jgi:DNA uptake protein ComE-like DNA-binding protein